jgi:endonuclease III-like uncharacterized protein|tara:strand:- start:5582 stop:5776 length:195 start_codon:yes stop_codon:yes gene_type:complete
LRYYHRGKPITELSDDQLKKALEKHMKKDPEWDGDVMAYYALVAEYNKRYDERERLYKLGEDSK